jgi:murein DD-endopeptidase MepM/ murein hydrolase activator NlpD
MPYRSYSHHPRREQAGPLCNARTQSHPPAPEARRTDYTFLHAGRQVRLGPVAFWVVVGTLVIMAGWSLTTATYFAFREDVLTRLIARQTEMQYGYEDRIADLRAQVDRLSSRQLLDQEQYEQKLDDVLRRQARLEQRAAALNGLPDAGVTGSIGGAARKDPPRGAKPSPINDTGPAIMPAERRASLLLSPRQGEAQPGLEAALARLQASLDRVEARQSAALNSVEASYGTRASRMRSVLAELGVKPAPIATGSRVAGIGGPFVPARPPAHADAFELQLYHAAITRIEVDRLSRTLASVPVRKPIMGEIDLSSGFGVRVDPFGHGAAMHTGLDFRGEPGDPVRATANGTVKTAGWSGGYGNMVEIDHGNGLSTRYGHLSAIEARAGQVVKVGQIIGRIGSTGRSTGPHLHYETRVNGEAVDPQKFLRAGARLAAVN